MQFRSSECQRNPRSAGGARPSKSPAPPPSPKIAHSMDHIPPKVKHCLQIFSGKAEIRRKPWPAHRADNDLIPLLATGLDGGGVKGWHPRRQKSDRSIVHELEKDRHENGPRPSLST